MGDIQLKISDNERQWLQIFPSASFFSLDFKMNPNKMSGFQMPPANLRTGSNSSEHGTHKQISSFDLFIQKFISLVLLTPSPKTNTHQTCCLFIPTQSASLSLHLQQAQKLSMMTPSSVSFTKRWPDPVTWQSL